MTTAASDPQIVPRQPAAAPALRVAALDTLGSLPGGNSRR